MDPSATPVYDTSVASHKVKTTCRAKQERGREQWQMDPKRETVNHRGGIIQTTLVPGTALPANIPFHRTSLSFRPLGWCSTACSKKPETTGLLSSLPCPLFFKSSTINATAPVSILLFSLSDGPLCGKTSLGSVVLHMVKLKGELLRAFTLAVKVLHFPPPSTPHGKKTMPIFRLWW